MSLIPRNFGGEFFILGIFIFGGGIFIPGFCQFNT